MMNNREIIIPVPKEDMKAALPILFLMTVIWGCSFYLSKGLYKYLGHYITFFLQSILAIIFVLFLIICIYAILQSKEPENWARFNNQGVWVRYFGFIPWADIDVLDKFQYGTPLVNIGIRVKDLKKLSKQSSFNGKMAIFWSKIFGYPPIVIGNTQMENEQIVAFAQHCMSHTENN